MHQILLRYLIQKQQLWLQGIGLIKMMQLPARYDVANKMMMGPMLRAKVENEPKDYNMQPLIVFLAKQTGTDEETAFEQYQAFCGQTAMQLQQQSVVNWPGLGSITQRGNEYNIKTDKALDAYLPNVAANRVIRQGSSHQIKVGETETTTAQMQAILAHQGTTEQTGRWWLAALFIFLAAGSCIVLRLLGKL
ncbi:MAG: hypothetical protein EAY75_08720 [Bacteroidetes bacterium]|nr:MAG: hypothetical protein EAY75_08720 [Bacteroidota bacterium]